MNGCVYRTTDDKCEFYSDYGKGIVSYCDFDDCEEKKPSNADKLRAMSDEEMAIWLSAIMDCSKCVAEIPCAKEITTKFCKDILCEWLKSPVEDGE